MGWKGLLGKKKSRQSGAGEINIWRLQALLNNFRRILLQNNAILEEMNRLERTLGGEFIFDKTFLDWSGVNDVRRSPCQKYERQRKSCKCKQETEKEGFKSHARSIMIEWNRAAVSGNGEVQDQTSAYLSSTMLPYQ